MIEGCETYATVLDIPHDIDLATLYVKPGIGRMLIATIAEKEIPELWVNPGAESEELVAQANDLGILVREHCSIVAIGQCPSDYE